MNKTTLLLNDDSMSRLSIMSGNVDIDKITPSIFAAQITKIRRILTPDLYNKIVSDFSGNTLSGQYLIIYDEFVVDMLTYFSLCDFITVGGFSITQSGIGKNVPDNVEPLDSEDTARLSEHYDELGYAIERLFDEYIKDNPIPEYKIEDENKGSNGLNWQFG